MVRKRKGKMKLFYYRRIVTRASQTHLTFFVAVSIFFASFCREQRGTNGHDYRRNNPRTLGRSRATQGRRSQQIKDSNLRQVRTLILAQTRRHHCLRPGGCQKHSCSQTQS